MRTSSSVEIDGRLVRTRRKLLGLSVATLAQRAGISRQYVSAIEVGSRTQVSAPVFVRLANALEVERERLASEQLGAVTPRQRAGEVPETAAA